MNLRKIIATLLASLLAPIIGLFRWLPNVAEAILYQRYTYYDFQITSLREFLCLVYCHSFLSISLLALIIFFIPFQITKDYYVKKGRTMSFFEKVGFLSLLMAMVIIIFGSFSNIWIIPWYKNLLYIFFALGFGIFFATLLFFLVDKHEETRTLSRSK